MDHKKSNNLPISNPEECYCLTVRSVRITKIVYNNKRGNFGGNLKFKDDNINPIAFEIFKCIQPSEINEEINLSGNKETDRISFQLTSIEYINDKVIIEGKQINKHFDSVKKELVDVRYRYVQLIINSKHFEQWINRNIK